MVKNLINEIEQAILGSLNNEQLAQLRKVLDYTFRNIVVTEKDSVNTESNNQILVNNFISAKKKLKDVLLIQSPIIVAL